MSTHTMDDFLNNRRLTDLARFAVPDGHDLWPEIERAARRSAAVMPASRPSILSLGFSHAWTAVGILLIAATFTILGFGLAMLALSNGEMSVPATQPEAAAITERATLTALYDATGGQDWKTNDGWLSDAPLDQWLRVTTAEDGRVTSLDVGSNRLSGKIPAELGNLQRLKLLYISDNNLIGVLPQSLTGISGLETFHFHNNPGLCAPIDETFQAWLRGIAEVRGSSCAPEDSLEDREVLVQLYNAMDGENWRNNANWLTEQPIREWHGVTNDASGRVDGLVLEWNGLAGEIPKELGSLSNLKRLEFGNNQLTGEIPRELGNLSKLEALNLKFNKLTGEIPAELGNLTSLETLLLDANRLSGEIPAELGDLSNLRSLELSYNVLTGEIPKELGSLSNLTRLLLGHNRLSGAFPSELGNLSNLKWLSIENNELSGCVPAKLSGVSKRGLGYRDLPFCSGTDR